MEEVSRGMSQGFAMALHEKLLGEEARPWRFDQGSELYNNGFSLLRVESHRSPVGLLRDALLELILTVLSDLRVLLHL